MLPRLNFVCYLFMVLELCLGLAFAAHAAPRPLEPADVQPLIALASTHDMWLETPFLSAPPAADSYFPLGPQSLATLRGQLELRELEQVLMVPARRRLHEDGHAASLRHILLHREANGLLTFSPGELLKRTWRSRLRGKRDDYKKALLEWESLPQYQRELLARADWTSGSWSELSLPARRATLLEVLWMDMEPTAEYGSAGYVKQLADALLARIGLANRVESDQGLKEIKAARQIHERAEAIREAIAKLDDRRDYGPRLRAALSAGGPVHVRDEIDRLFKDMGLDETLPAQTPLRGLASSQRGELLDMMEAVVRRRLENHPLSPHLAALMKHSGLAPITIIPGLQGHYVWSGVEDGDGYQSRVRLNLMDASLDQALRDLGHVPDGNLNIPRAAVQLAHLYLPLFVEAAASYRQTAWILEKAEELGAPPMKSLDNLAALWVKNAERKLFWDRNLLSRRLVSRLHRRQNGLGFLVGWNAPKGPPSFHYRQLIYPSLEGAVARALPASLDDGGAATLRLLAEYVVWIRGEVARLEQAFKAAAERTDALPGREVVKSLR